MNSESLHEPAQKRHTDYWCTKFHIVGCLGRAVSELDRDGNWRNGSRIAHTREERLQAHAVRILMAELRRLGAVNDERS